MIRAIKFWAYNWFLNKALVLIVSLLNNYKLLMINVYAQNKVRKLLKLVFYRLLFLSFKFFKTNF